MVDLLLTASQLSFGPSCGLNIDGDEAELEFESRLYFYDNTVGITDSPFESTFWTYDPAWSNAGPILSSI